MRRRVPLLALLPTMLALAGCGAAAPPLNEADVQRVIAGCDGESCVAGAGACADVPLAGAEEIPSIVASTVRTLDPDDARGDGSREALRRGCERALRTRVE